MNESIDATQELMGCGCTSYNGRNEGEFGQAWVKADALTAW